MEKKVWQLTYLAMLVLRHCPSMSQFRTKMGTALALLTLFTHNDISSRRHLSAKLVRGDVCHLLILEENRVES
jgi:hypothetical protein